MIYQPSLQYKPNIRPSDLCQLLRASLAVFIVKNTSKVLLASLA